MKYLLEIILIAVLITVLYQPPTFLQMQLNSFWGKLLFVSIISYMTVEHGLNAGILSAFITIVLMNNTFEGIDETLKDKNNEGDTDDDDADTPGNDDNEDDDEDDNEDGNTAETVDNDNNRNEDSEDSDDDDDDDDDNDDDDSNDNSSKPTKEGYSNINIPLTTSSINLVDHDRLVKVNALKNNARSKTLSNGVINDVKGLLNRVTRLELLQEDMEDEMDSQSKNLESYEF
jgi:hypothetical protein